MTRNDKIVYIAGAAAVVALCFYVRSCTIKSIIKNTHSDTVILTRTDTVTTTPQPDTIIETVTKTLKGKNSTDTLWIERDIAATDTLGELRRLQLVERKYNQKLTYTDSAKGSTWRATVFDTVYQNHLTNRRWLVTTTDSVINNRTVIKPPRPLVLSFTTSLIGNARSPLFGQGVGLQLKLSNESAYSIQVFNITNHKPMFQVTKTWPIRLGRK